MGWSDWISTCAAVAAIAIVFAESLIAALGGSIVFLIWAVLTDARHSAIAVALLIISYPVFRWMPKP